MTKIRTAALLILILGAAAGFFASSEFTGGLLPVIHRPYRLGLDLKGGTHLVYRAEFSREYERSKNEAMSALRDVIERRVNLFGVTEPLVQTETSSGERRLIVELAGITDINEAKRLIGKTPFLEFREMKEADELKEISGEKGEVAPELVTKTTGLDGQYLERALLEFDPQTNSPLVVLQFNAAGAKLFEEITERNISKPVAIFLDGSPISAPVVQEKISGGRAQITGSFNPEEARTLVGRMNAGALPVPITLVSEQSVEASLGKDSLDKSFYAALWGFLTVVLFMILWYRLPGLVAVAALFIYASFVLSIFKLIPVTLTAASIAGFVLSLGMAVDANILIFERFKEELRRGRSVDEALRYGFDRAWTSIRDSNVSSLITAAILFWLGTSVVKGFALTLGVGVVVSMFSAISVSRTFLRLILAKWSDEKRFILLSGLGR